MTTFNHYVSLYNCPEALVQQIENAVSVIRKRYTLPPYNGSVVFEHGVVDNIKLSSTSINHIHLHFLPVNESIWLKILNKYHFNYYVIHDFSEIRKTIDRNKLVAYILFYDYDNQLYLIDCSYQNYPSQLFRKVLYEYYYGESHYNEWDWKKYPFYCNMVKTKEALNNSIVL